MASDLAVHQLPGLFNHSLDDLKKLDAAALVNMTILPRCAGHCSLRVTLVTEDEKAHHHLPFLLCVV